MSKLELLLTALASPLLLAATKKKAAKKGAKKSAAKKGAKKRAAKKSTTRKRPTSPASMPMTAPESMESGPMTEEPPQPPM